MTNLHDRQSAPDPVGRLPTPDALAGIDLPAVGAATSSERGMRVEIDEPSDVASVAITGPSDPYLGRTFGGYLLEARIGQGGMGTVYRGRQVSLDRVVAIKILNKQLSENAEFIKRFEREAKSIARINHPNIVSVYDFGKCDGLWYMVNEFIEGSSLSRLIAQRIMVPLDELGPMVMQCLSGLALVGRLDIVHRDIKPDNILITTDNIPKIADFGLAKSTNEHDDTNDLTAVGLAMGTPAYMSPEQCLGRAIDHRSDQYSLGITAYVALTGSKPFTGQSSFEVMTKQRELVPPPPHQLNPALPAACSAVVMRMLAKDPGDRYPDPEACRQAWADLLQRQAEGALDQPRADLPGGAGRSARMRSSLISVDGFAVAAAPGTVPGGLPADLPPPPVPTPAPAVRPGSEGRFPSSAAPASAQSGRRPTMELAVEPKPGSERFRPTPPQCEALTCPRCGQLNRATAPACQRCGSALHPHAPANPGQDQQEAQRLLDAGRHLEAAALFARLAEQESDRRQKSVLRAREREARKADLDRQLADIRNRAEGQYARGDLDGAIETLSHGRNLVDSSASGTSFVQPLAQRAAEITAQLAARRRRRALLTAGVILAGIAVALAVWLAGQARAALPARPATAAEPAR